MYVEYIQEFIHKDLNTDPEPKPARAMLSEPPQASSLGPSGDVSRAQDFSKNVNVDKVYGFRYNQIVDAESSDCKTGSPRPPQQDPDSPQERAGKGKHRKKGNGMIKLPNGLPLSLDDEAVDLGCDLLKGRQRERALEHQEQVQGYYDEIRKSLRDTQYNQNKIIKYKRSHRLNEAELDADHGRTLRELQRIKLEKYTRIREKQPAFSTNMTKFIHKEYAIPFRDYQVREFDPRFVDPTDVARFKRARDKHLKHPWVGFKGKEFVLKCKLQSHGCCRQLKELRAQMSEVAETIEDVDLYSKVLDPDGYPIYLLFEVIHVYRIRDRDR